MEFSCSQSLVSKVARDLYRNIVYAFQPSMHAHNGLDDNDGWMTYEWVIHFMTPTCLKKLVLILKHCDENSSTAFKRS